VRRFWKWIAAGFLPGVLVGCLLVPGGIANPVVSGLYVAGAFVGGLLTGLVGCIVGNVLVPELYQSIKNRTQIRLVPGLGMNAKGTSVHFTLTNCGGPLPPLDFALSWSGGRIDFFHRADADRTDELRMGQSEKYVCYLVLRNPVVPEKWDIQGLDGVPWFDSRDPDFALRLFQRHSEVVLYENRQLGRAIQVFFKHFVSDRSLQNHADLIAMRAEPESLWQYLIERKNRFFAGTLFSLNTYPTKSQKDEAIRRTIEKFHSLEQKKSAS
jgi:hypothetical protein